MWSRILAVAAAPTLGAAHFGPQDGNLASDSTRLFPREQRLPMRFAEPQGGSDPAYSRPVVRGRR